MSLASYHTEIADRLEAKARKFEPVIGRYVDRDGLPFPVEYDEVHRMIEGHRILARRAES